MNSISARGAAPTCGMKDEKMSKSIEPDRYWCNEGCGFVDANHRCEQWCLIDRIPGEAVEKIKQEITGIIRLKE